MGRAEGLAATLGDGVVGSTDGLIAYLWQVDGQPILALEALETSVSEALKCSPSTLPALPALPVPQPDRTPWGERVYVPAERMGEVAARLSADLPLGSWDATITDGREWVVAHAVIDLAAIVDDVLAP